MRIQDISRAVKEKILIPGPVALSGPAGYDSFMFMNDYFIVFPEGDVQEISGRLPLNSIVDVNGCQLSLPLPTSRMIAFRVYRIKVNENKGGNETLHYLELLSAEELRPLARP